MRLAPFSSGASYGSPLAHEVGLWLQFDVGRQHRWVFCAVSSPVGHAKIDQMSPVWTSTAACLTEWEGFEQRHGHLSPYDEGDTLMLPVVTMLAPRVARSACSGAAAGASPTPRRGAVRATGSHIDGDHAGGTRSQAQCGRSVVPAAHWEGHGWAQGASRRSEGEIIDL